MLWSKKRVINYLTFIIALLILIPIVSAGMTIEDPKVLYNIGDKLDVKITINAESSINDFVIVKLVCGVNEIILYKIPLSVKTNDLKEVLVSTNLDKGVIGNSVGECIINASYGSKTNSKKFIISKDINVTLKTNKLSFDPGETIKLSGTAYKSNGDALNGLLDVILIGTSGNTVVKSGEFAADFVTLGNISVGSYNLTAHAYESDSFGEIANEGIGIINIKINQIVKRADIVISSQKISPGEKLVYTPLVYDQSDNEIKEIDIGVVIYDPKNNTFLKSPAKSGKNMSFETKSNYSSGNWRIEINSVNISAEKIFFIELKENVSFTLINNTIVINNEGNIVYNKTLEIIIGDVKELKEIVLKISKNKTLYLQAPDGEYNVAVSNGSNFSNLGKTFLTGKAISIIDPESKLGKNLVIALWILIIIILGVVVLYYYNKIYRKPFVDSSFSLWH